MEAKVIAKQKKTARTRSLFSEAEYFKLGGTLPSIGEEADAKASNAQTRAPWKKS